MKTLLHLLRTTRELIVLAPLAAGVLIAILAGYTALTGRPTAVSLVPLVEFAIALLRFTLCAAFAALIQESALGYRAEKPGGRLSDDLADAAIFLALLAAALLSTASF